MKVDLGAICQVGRQFGAAFRWLRRGTSRVDAEAGLGGGVDVEEMGDGWGEGVAVEDAGMAKDVHEKGVGAGGGVEFAPLPVFAGDGAARGGVGFGETVQPGWVGADLCVGVGVKVAVAACSSRPKMTAGLFSDFGPGAIS